MLRRTIAITFALAAAACASAPPSRPPHTGSTTFEQKMAWILRLEDQRMLRDPAPPVAPPSRRRRLRRGEKAAGRCRRRRRRPISCACSATARRACGAAPRWRSDASACATASSRCVALLRDADPEVRQMAAFALGLIGDKAARGSAGDGARRPVAARAGQRRRSARPHRRRRRRRRDRPPGVAGRAVRRARRHARRRRRRAARSAGVGVPAGDLRARPAEGVRPAGGRRARSRRASRRVRWWPVAYALQRLDDKRALGALLALAKDAHPYTRAFAAKGLGALKDASAVPTLLPLLAEPRSRASSIESVRALGRIGDPSPAPAAAEADPGERTPIRTCGSKRWTRSAACTRPACRDLLLDSLSDPQPGDPRRGAADPPRRSIPSSSSPCCRGSIPIPIWSVRAALASALGTLPPDIGAAAADDDAGRSGSARHPGGARGARQASARRTRRPILLRAPEGRRSGGARRRRDRARRAEAAERRSRRSPTPIEFGQRDAAYTARAAALAALVEVRRGGGDAGAEDGAGRQGLGRPRPRGDAAEGARSGVGCRRRSADSSRADDR